MLNDVDHNKNVITCCDVVVELETEPFFFVFGTEIGDEITIATQNRVPVIHRFPLSLRVEHTHRVVNETPQELSRSFRFVKEPVIHFVVLLFE